MFENGVKKTKASFYHFQFLAAFLSFLLPLAAFGDPHANFQWLDPVLQVPQNNPTKNVASSNYKLVVTGSLAPSGVIDFRVTTPNPQDVCVLAFGADVDLDGNKTIENVASVLAGTSGWYVIEDYFAAMLYQTSPPSYQSMKIPVGSYPPDTVSIQAVCTSNPFASQPVFQVTNVKQSHRGHQWVIDDAVPTWTNRFGHGVASLAGKIYLMAGAPNNLPVNDVHRYDGTKWTQVLAHDPNATNRFSPRTGALIASHQGRLWIATGTTGAYSYAKDLWSSVDGISWQLESADLQAQGGPTPREGARMVSFNNRLWVFGGKYKPNATPITYNDLYAYDSSSKKWTKYGPPSFAGEVIQARTGHTFTVHAGRLYIIGGELAVTTTVPYQFLKFNDAWSSADGINWQKETDALTYISSAPAGVQASAPYLHVAASFNGLLRVIGGYGTFNYQWQSFTGKAWKVPLELGGPGFNYGNKPVASAAKAVMPVVTLAGAEAEIISGKLCAFGGGSTFPFLCTY